MKVEIRCAMASDVPQLVGLLQQLSLGRESRESPENFAAYERAFQGVIDDPRQRLLVAVEGETVVGTAAFVVVPSLSHAGRPYALVEDVVVDSGSRGKGYGEALMRYAIELAEEAGCYKLMLTSNRQRTDAHRFYERLGFSASHVGFRMDLQAASAPRTGCRPSLTGREGGM